MSIPANSKASALLDADTPDSVRMMPDAAHALGMQALHRIGFSDEDARIVVDQLIDNALCGYRFTSLPRILAIAEDPRTREPRQPVKIVHETALAALLDGGNNVGYVSVYHGTQLAIKKAQQNGFASVGVFNSYYSGRNAYFVEMIAKAGLVGIHVASAAPASSPRACIANESPYPL